MNFIKLIQESRTDPGRGSKAGREKFTSKEGTKGKEAKDNTKAQKSRVRVYDTIDDALKHGHYGQMFSTKGSGRLYVVTKQKWGTDPDQRVGDKVAKGFSPGTIPASFNDVKKYSVRTIHRHGKAHNRRFASKKFWSQRKKI